ncbi:ATP-dependent RNA helicase RhlE [Planctomycetes bacterium CA13]|uniref:DEAD-box ATP-dependent RNA helicase RhpA n=2 Tax=Novipirellula herctigrandis TaxID=2527986 RepID=A0A5C5Z2L4_9BACT|nr:ATP-dependent RNA helicase RhlE [Planctomycetes bacterium CA13]
MDLIEPIKRSLKEQNYTTPTPIQAQTIPAALDERDILGVAQTGTGKTAAFALPILNQLGERHRKASPNRPLALVLAPTRELAIQIGESFSTYGKHLRLRHVLVYGGVSQGNQVRALKRGAHVLVATPGRLLDLMNQGHIDLDRLEVFVLDEADRMLDMGFLPDLKRIIECLPDDRQSLFFSATMPPKIRELSERLLEDPVAVNVTPKTTSVKRIEQRVAFLDRNSKMPTLQKLLSGKNTDRVIVFTRTKRGANVLAEKLSRHSFKAVAIHGNKSQNARQRALDAFKRNHVQVLVATDVAARGIDIDGVTHVVNYDMPVEPESYVHRIGRTGRAGAEGIAISYCTHDERSELQAIEKLIGQKIPLDPNHPKPDARDMASPPRDAKPKSGRRRFGSQKSGYKPARKNRSTGTGSTDPQGQRNGKRPSRSRKSKRPQRAAQA